MVSGIVDNPGESALKGEVLATIGSGRTRGVRRWLWRGGALAAAVALVSVVVWRSSNGNGHRDNYLSVAAKRAGLRATVTATGTLKPLDQVEVGAEISGTISAVHADFNDRVSAGQVLCEIEASQRRAAVEQAHAQLRARQADLTSQLASAVEARLDAERTEKLWAQDMISKQTLEAAVARTARAEAAVASAKAQILLSRASLKSSQITLEKTKIRAPIDGVVLSRTVEPGQTVAASFATPVLFVLAKDLTKMEVEVDVDEADIGKVAVDQTAAFTVDAFPGSPFPAKVTSIRNTSTIVDNVVTYEAVLTVENDELLLRPGMTATVTIITAVKTDALLIPNAALRFTPPSEIKKTGPSMAKVFGGGDSGKREEKKSRKPTANRPRIWTLRNGLPIAVAVETGLSDGEWTEVLNAAVEPGTEVIVDLVETEK